MLCCTPASWLSSMIVFSTSAASVIVLVSKATPWAVTITIEPAPVAPVAPAGARGGGAGGGGGARRARGAGAPATHDDLPDHRRMDQAVVRVLARVERRDLVLGLRRARDQLAREEGVAARLGAAEDLHVVLCVAVAVVEHDRERLTGGRLDAVPVGERQPLGDDGDLPVDHQRALLGRGRQGLYDVGGRRAWDADREVAGVPVGGEHQVL